MMRRNSWLVVTGGVFALLVLLMVGLALYWRYANQLPTYARAAVVLPDPNAYDDYVAAGQLCRSVGGASLSPAAAGRRAEAYEPNVPLEQVRAVVQRNRPALARLRQGFRKQFRAPPAVASAPTYPEFADYRALAKVLVAEGKLAEREGRPNEAVSSYLDCLRLGLDVPRGGVMIHGLVGLAIEDIGLDFLNRVTERLDAPTAAAAARELARLDAKAPRLADVLSEEKEHFTASLLQTFRQSPGPGQLAANFSGGGGQPPFGSRLLLDLRYSLTPKKRILERVRGYFDALIADARLPYSPNRPLPPAPSDPISALIVPPISGLKGQWVKRDSQRRTAMIRLATRAYHLRHGTRPPSPAALAPRYLPAIPLDPYAPQR